MQQICSGSGVWISEVGFASAVGLEGKSLKVLFLSCALCGKSTMSANRLFCMTLYGPASKSTGQIKGDYLLSRHWQVSSLPPSSLSLSTEICCSGTLGERPFLFLDHFLWNPFLTSLVISYLSVPNYCTYMSSHFHSTFGSHLLFGMPFNLRKYSFSV